MFGSPWLNVKLGKFELDNLLSEKRILTLTGNGGVYQLYHFIPSAMATSSAKWATTSSALEVMGHSANDRTRYSAALISSMTETSACRTAMPTPASSPPVRHSTSASWAWIASAFYAMVGEAPTIT